MKEHRIITRHRAASASNGETRSRHLRVTDLPRNTPAETERVERAVQRVLEEHRETIEKLADE